VNARQQFVEGPGTPFSAFHLSVTTGYSQFSAVEVCRGDVVGPLVPGVRIPLQLTATSLHWRNYKLPPPVSQGPSHPILCKLKVHANHTTTKIATEFSNVGDAAYAMSHAAAEAYAQRLAAGRGHGYRLAAPSQQPERGTGSGPAC